MNLIKSFLGVASGKFLGFVVTFKGIHLDPEKVRAIQEIQPPRNLRELRGLQRATSIYSEVYLKSLRMMPTLHQIDKEVCFIHLGRCLPTSVRENQAVPSRIHLSLQLQCQENFS